MGCFEALSLATMEADPAAPDKAMDFIDGLCKIHEAVFR